MAAKSEPQAEMEQVEMQLTAILFRHQCPPPDRLHLYSWSQLDETERGKLDAHLAECPLCREEALELQALAPAPFQTEAKTDQGQKTAADIDLGRFAQSMVAGMGETLAGIRMTVAQLVKPEAGAPALSGLRAGESALPSVTRLLYETESYDLDLALQPTGPKSFSLSGQLLALAADEPLSGAFRLTPQTPHSPEQTGIIDDNGTFILPDLEVDSFQLLLAVGSFRIVVPEIAPPR